MKKILLVSLCTIIFTGAFTGCECKHKEWKDATCTSPKICVKCNKEKGEPNGHNWKDATCKTLKTCTVCEETEGEFADHKWQEATCKAPKTCTVCEETEGELAEHKWQEATCKAPKTCTVCEKTEGEVTEHKWNDATCETPKKCAYCEKTDGSELGHSWIEATYDAPKTCKICEKTEGVPLEKPPVLITFKNSFPSNYSYYNWNNEIEDTIKLTEVTYTVEEDWSGNYEVTLYFTGEKIYDRDGNNQGRTGKISYRIFDSEGYVIDNDTYYTPSLRVGEKFRADEESLWTTDFAKGSYVIEFGNTN